MKHCIRKFARYLSGFIWLSLCFALAVSSAYGAPLEDNSGYLIDAESVSEMGNPNVNPLDRIDIKRAALHNTHFVDMLFVADRTKETKDVMNYVLKELKDRKQKLNLKMGLVHEGKADESYFKDINQELKDQGHGDLVFMPKKEDGRSHKTMLDGLIAILKDIVEHKKNSQKKFFREPSDAGTKQNILVYVSENDSKKYLPPRRGWFNFLAFILFVVVTGGLGFASVGLFGSLGAGAVATAVGLGMFSGSYDLMNDDYYSMAEETLEQLRRLVGLERHNKHIDAHEAYQVLEGVLVPVVGQYEVWSFVGGAENKRYERKKAYEKDETDLRIQCKDGWCSHRRDAHMFKVVKPNTENRQSLYPSSVILKPGQPPPPGARTSAKSELEKEMKRHSYTGRLKMEQDGCLARMLDPETMVKPPKPAGCSYLCEQRYHDSIKKLKNKPNRQLHQQAYEDINQKAGDDVDVIIDAAKIKEIFEASKTDSNTSIDTSLNKQTKRLTSLKLTYEYKKGVYVTRSFDHGVKVFSKQVCEKLVNNKLSQKAVQNFLDHEINPIPFCIKVCAKTQPKQSRRSSGGNCKYSRPGDQFMELAVLTRGLNSGLCALANKNKDTEKNIGEALTSRETLFSYGGSRVKLSSIPKKFVSIQIQGTKGKGLLDASTAKKIVKNLNEDLNRKEPKDWKKGDKVRSLVIGDTLYLPLVPFHFREVVENKSEIGYGGVYKEAWEDFIKAYTPEKDPEETTKDKLFLIVEFIKKTKN